MRPSHFFKYHTANVAKIVLATQRVRWNSPLNFDDPFDCFFSVEPKFDFAQMSRKMREQMLDILFQVQEPNLHSGNPHSDVITELRQKVKNIPREKLNNLIDPVFANFASNLESISLDARARWAKQISNYRLFCVCETNDNLLLWSKYTNSHTGAAFQFECITALDVPLLVAQPIIYSDEAPGLSEEEWMKFALGSSPQLTDENLWNRLVTTKARAWEHEKEWRVISQRRHYENEGYEDVKFCPREISRVFLGCRMTDSDKADILSLLSGPFTHTEAYQARQHPRKYALEFERIK